MKSRIKSALVGDDFETKLLLKECEEHIAQLIREWQKEASSATNLRCLPLKSDSLK